MPTIVITGCDTGLGVEFARQYAAEGHRVLATCLNPDTAHDTRAIKGNVEVMKLDMTDHGDIAALGRHLAGAPVDILVSNAGIGRPHPPFGQTDYDNWRRILETNLIGPMKLAETLVDNIAAGELKIMAFVSSRMGSIALNNSGGSYAYRSSKAGLNMMVKGPAVALAPRPIRGIALHPRRAATEPGGRAPVPPRGPGMRGAVHRPRRPHPRTPPTPSPQPPPSRSRPYGARCRGHSCWGRGRAGTGPSGRSISSTRWSRRSTAGARATARAPRGGCPRSSARSRSARAAG